MSDTARPVNAHSGQVHCFVDTSMASMEVCHIVSAGWWNDHSFTLGQDVTIDGELITEAPVKSSHSGDATLSVRPTVQGVSVHCQEDGVPLFLCTDLGQTSQGEGKHQYGIDSEIQLDLSVCSGWEAAAEDIHQKHSLLPAGT